MVAIAVATAMGDDTEYVDDVDADEDEVDEVGDEHRRKVIWKLLKE